MTLYRQTIVGLIFALFASFQRYYSFCGLNTHFFYNPLLYHLKFGECFPCTILIMLGAAKNEDLHLYLWTNPNYMTIIPQYHRRPDRWRTTLPWHYCAICIASRGENKTNVCVKQYSSVKSRGGHRDTSPTRFRSMSYGYGVH